MADRIDLQPASERRALRPQEVADQLRCGKTNVYDLMERGDLATTRTGAGRKGLRVMGARVSCTTYPSRRCPRLSVSC